jgi:hypothetical protein
VTAFAFYRRGLAVCRTIRPLFIGTFMLR